MQQLNVIKSQIRSLLGKEVTVYTREQRGKIEKFQGTIDQIYHSFFNLETKGYYPQKMSFNFVDILTNEIVVLSADNKIVVKNTPK